MFRRILGLGSLLALATQLLSPTDLVAQSDVAAKPIVGLRDNRPQDYALVNATVIVRPGQSIEAATVLIEGSTITTVGQAIEVPAGYRKIDCTNRLIYAGLIDAYSDVEVSTEQAAGSHWNRHVRPERTAVSAIDDATKHVDKLRSQGLTIRLVAPRGGIVKGNSCLVLLADEAADRNRSDRERSGSEASNAQLLQPTAWHHLQLTVPRGSGRPRGYPNSPMGAVALLRQTMLDAAWYRDAWAAYRANSKLPRPETNVALEALAAAIGTQTFVFDAPNERMAIRAGAIADEFSLSSIIRGSGREYRRSQQIADLNRPVLVPVNFPEAPDVADDESARNTSLEDLMHWELAPENAGRLHQAGVRICLTTDRLEDAGQFLKNVRRAVDRGLEPDAALAALTTTPARLLGIDDQVGTVQAGMLANLVIADGPLFDQDTEILQTWVAGKQFAVTSDIKSVTSRWSGRWQCVGDGIEFVVELKEKNGKIAGKVFAEGQQDDSVSLGSVAVIRDRLTATLKLHDLDTEYPQGSSRLSLQFISTGDDTDRFAGLTLPDGTAEKLNLTALEDDAEDASDNQGAKGDETSDEPESAVEASAEGLAEADDETAGEVQTESSEESVESEEPKQPETELVESIAPIPNLFPLGAYGLETPIVNQGVVLFRDATIWTCGPAGVVDQADLLIRDGKIVEIGQDLPVPEDCQIIDGRQKHITPGLIDCHSHIASDGGINEYGQAVSAEVRIGDFIDNTSISIYRQLAGGTTAANILHGSANPIGGQNQVIKFRWGDTMEALKMKQAPPGIKFALGENVKRNQSRYPNTRMGVEQIIRDQLLAAREYQAKWKRWRSGNRNSLPPRRDLQLEALSEVQQGQRWIHCHSYRQDEIVALLDLLDEFGIQIGTLQHILEGYKVADRMAAHGAMGSSFSDWWAYKFEVFDAIPYNGALMHRQGIVVSFNSDDSELGRRLNIEAAKATKYGELPEEEALKFVTLNPAKQLRIDQYVGSLEVGKHADLVVWSGRPLSTLSRCEQTWVDGRQYFSLESDQQLRQRDAELRARLIQKVLASDQKPKEKGDKQEVDEEDRWYRHDIFCGAHGGRQYDQRGEQ